MQCGDVTSHSFPTHAVDIPPALSYSAASMNFTSLLTSPRFLLAAGFGLLLSACSTKVKGDGATITKVNPYHLLDENGVSGADPSLAFERERLLHGAITDKEREARLGDYYTIFWKVADRSQPVTVRLEYRQKAFGLAVKKVEKEVTDIGRDNTTHFEFIGDDYIVNGPVTAWRASIVRGGTVLVSYNSYLWE